MASTASLEGVKKAVLFPFGGRGWGVKWVIGSALGLANSILPFLPMIPLYGYVGQIAKRVILHDEDPELPEWGDWGLFFSDGIKIFGAAMVFMLPGGLAMFLGFLLMFGMNFAFLFDPQFYNNPEAVMTGFMMASLFGTFAGILVMVVGMLLMAAAGLFMLPALGHLVARGEFGAAFRVGEWWPIFKANFGGFLMALLIMYGVNMVFMWAVYALYFTVVLCFLMPFALYLATFLMTAIQFSLISVAYRDGARKAAEAG